jgi:2,3-bisphosphoglycerate-independent phosphoglycerate mutase
LICLFQSVPFHSSYILVVTADHGNAEEMYAEDGKSPKTSHTTNLIPLIIMSPKQKVEWNERVTGQKDSSKPTGGLSDVAPTVLTLMGLKVPKEMTGKPLVKPLQ